MELVKVFPAQAYWSGHPGSARVQRLVPVWHGWQESNLQPAVLETAALAS